MKEQSKYQTKNIMQNDMMHSKSVTKYSIHE